MDRPQFVGAHLHAEDTTSEGPDATSFREMQPAASESHRRGLIGHCILTVSQLQIMHNDVMTI